MSIEDNLRNQISYEEYIQLRKLQAQDEYLTQLREIVFRQASDILKTEEGDRTTSLDEAMYMCEYRDGVDAYLDLRNISVDEPDHSKIDLPEMDQF